MRQMPVLAVCFAFVWMAANAAVCELCDRIPLSFTSTSIVRNNLAGQASATDPRGIVYENVGLYNDRSFNLAIATTSTGLNCNQQACDGFQTEGYGALYFRRGSGGGFPIELTYTFVYADNGEEAVHGHGIMKVRFAGRNLPRLCTGAPIRFNAIAKVF